MEQTENIARTFVPGRRDSPLDGISRGQGLTMLDRTSQAAEKAVEITESPSLEADEELAVRGDNAAFITLYRRHLRTVYSYLYSRLGSVQEAEDLTAQTFERAWASLASYRPTGLFKGWLFTIAYRTFADYYRHRRVHTVAGSEADYLVDGSLGPEAAVMQAEQLQFVLSVIATLSEEQQEIISLRFMAELHYKEIAQIMGKREAAVKMAAYRALAEVRRRCADVDE